MWFSCLTLLWVVLLASPAMARIAPGTGGGCPEGLTLDTQSGKCLPPGESRPALGAPNDPSSNPVKSLPAEVKPTEIKGSSPNNLGVPVPPKPLPANAKEEEAQEACAPFPGTVARALAGGYVCIPAP